LYRLCSPAHSKRYSSSYQGDNCVSLVFVSLPYCMYCLRRLILAALFSSLTRTGITIRRVTAFPPRTGQKRFYYR
jgi:hypothetical protein